MFLYQQAQSKAALLLAISYLLPEAVYKNKNLKEYSQVKYSYFPFY